MNHSKPASLTVWLWIVISCFYSYGQQLPGDQALANKDWESAEKLFRAELQENARNGSAWFGLGEALYGEQRFADSANAYKRAATENFESMRSQFREARSLARAGETAEAFSVLNELNRQGF